MTALGAAAQAARVTIYVLRLEIPILDASDRTVSPTLQADQQAREDGLVRLAGTARGALFRLVGADPYPFNRILRELSGYYLVAFEATPADRDGRTHRIDVSVDAPDASVRAQPHLSRHRDAVESGNRRSTRAAVAQPETGDGDPAASRRVLVQGSEAWHGAACC